MERPSDPGLDQVPPAELRARLHRAEETLRAIRSGEVDAFIVAGERGPRVVMLEGTAHPYIALMERINEGAVTLSADGEILYCNLFLARLLDMAREQLIGSAFRDLVVPEDRPLAGGRGPSPNPRRAGRQEW